MDKNTKKIIVNSLTASRIVGALALPVVFNFMSIPALVALVTLLFTTDFLDGKLARKWEVQTVGGSLLDPLGDKVLALSCILSLIGTETLLLAPLFLELSITGINVNRALHEENVKSSMLGKTKTWLLSIALVLGVIYKLNPNILNDIVNTVLPNLNLPDLTVTSQAVGAAVGCTIAAETVTATDYIKQSLKADNERTKKIAELKNLKECLQRLFDETKYEEDKDKPVVKVLKK